VFHARTNHIEVEYQLVGEKVAQGALDVRFMSLEDQEHTPSSNPQEYDARVIKRQSQLGIPPLRLRGNVSDNANIISRVYRYSYIVLIL
jgi:hypothetical protein